MDHDLKSLQQQEPTEGPILYVSSYYRVSKKEDQEPPTLFRMVYHVDDVYNIIKEYKDDDEEKIIYCIYAEQDLSDIIYQLYKTYIPDIEFETGRVSKVIYKSKNVKVIVKCQDIITSSIERTIGIIDDIDVYNRMNIQMIKFNKALSKMQYKSYYTDQDIDILNEYRTVPNIFYFFSTTAKQS